MNKRELLGYIGAVCDAENAKYACEEMIAAYEREKETIPQAAEPQKPTRTLKIDDSEMKQKTSLNPFEDFLSIISALVFGGIGLVVGWIFFVALLQLFMEMGWKLILGTVLGIVTACFFFTVSQGLTKRLISKSKKNKYLAQANEEADQRFKRETREYEKQYSEYQKAKRMENSALATIDHSIKEQQDYINNIQRQLDQLYQRNIINPYYRELVAVNRLYYYLSIGICDTLQGPMGAYTKYEDDLRANRITRTVVSRLDRMENNLMHSLNKIANNQQQLMYELRETSLCIQNIHSSFSDFSYQLSEYQRSASQQLSTASNHLSKANDLLTDIKNTSRISAHNQYVVAKQANINSYLLRRP